MSEPNQGVQRLSLQGKILVKDCTKVMNMEYRIRNQNITIILTQLATGHCIGSAKSTHNNIERLLEKFR